MQGNFEDKEHAVAHIETWLLAPTDFMEVVPSLAALRTTSSYAEQRRALSIYLGRSEAEIDLAVDGYLSRRAPSHTAPDSYTLNAQHVHAVHYVDPNMTYCGKCGAAMPLYQGRTQLKSGGCFLTALLVIFFFPLFWLPLVFFRERKPEAYCVRCKNRFHIQ